MAVAILAHSGAVFKDLSTTDANELNKLTLYSVYLSVLNLNQNDIMYLTHLSQQAQKKEEKEKLEFEINIHKCTTIFFSELTWHFDKETLPSNNDGADIINFGLEDQKKLEKINFDCSEYEEQIDKLYHRYIKEVLTPNTKK